MVVTTKKIKKTRNKFEERICLNLRRRGVRYEYEPRKFAYVSAHHYTPDLGLDIHGGELYVELKGYLRPEDKRKILCVRRQYPSMDLRIVFYEYREANVRWCKRNGIPFAIGEIPEEWLTCSPTNSEIKPTSVKSGKTITRLELDHSSTAWPQD
jgi:Phage endonuclease I